jgi:hypothetical protein
MLIRKDKYLRAITQAASNKIVKAYVFCDTGWVDNTTDDKPNTIPTPTTFGRQVQYGVQRPTQYLQQKPIVNPSLHTVTEVVPPSIPITSTADSIIDVPVSQRSLPPTVEISAMLSDHEFAELIAKPEAIEIAKPAEPFVHPAGPLSTSQHLGSPQPKKRKRRLAFAAVTGLLLISIGAVVAIKNMNQGDVASLASRANYTAAPQSYKAVVRQFIVALQKKDKASADKLQSFGFTAELKAATGSPSFYDNCQKTGKSCTVMFSNLFISPSKTSDANYMAADKTIGKSISYTAVAAAGISATTLTINAITKGGTWQIDGIDIQSALSTAGGLSKNALQGGISIADQTKVLADVQNAQTKLEAAFAVNGSYPGDLLSLGLYTLPKGVSYSYNATPVGCTTENKKCTGYALLATSTIDGAILVSKSDLNH